MMAEAKTTRSTAPSRNAGNAMASLAAKNSSTVISPRGAIHPRASASSCCSQRSSARRIAKITARIKAAATQAAAEVSVDKKKKVTLHKVTVVGDIGPIVNLSGAENQCQGCVVDAFSQLAQEVTIENGRIKEKNFDTYKLARMPVTPAVDVHFLDTNYPPTGVGEPAFPPAGPAICNAIYAATKERIRTMPITRQGFSIA